MPHIHYVRHAMVSDPEEMPLTCHSPMNILTSVNITTSSLLILTLSRLNPFNLTAYGLSSRYPTLNLWNYSHRSKDALPSGWPAFRGGVLSRLNIRPRPGRTMLWFGDFLPIKLLKNRGLSLFFCFFTIAS